MSQSHFSKKQDDQEDDFFLPLSNGCADTMAGTPCIDPPAWVGGNGSEEGGGRKDIALSLSTVVGREKIGIGKKKR